MDNDYEPPVHVRELAEASGYGFLNLSIDVSDKSETEIEKIRNEAYRLGEEVRNLPLVLRDRNRLAVFCKRM